MKWEFIYFYVGVDGSNGRPEEPYQALHMQHLRSTSTTAACVCCTLALTVPSDWTSQGYSLLYLVHDKSCTYGIGAPTATGSNHSSP